MDTTIDLSAADLDVADLSEANLSAVKLAGTTLNGANLHGANLSEADLSGDALSRANLSRANLTLANLASTNFIEANLEGATLVAANLYAANLGGANLINADLTLANLMVTNLEKANFEKAMVYRTHFADLDLRQVIGLENLVHGGPSTLGTDTIARSTGKIPEIFLRGCGLSDLDIEYAKVFNPELDNEDINRIVYKIYDIRATQAIQISPLFISYSHADSAFVDKLETYLNKQGIRFWRDIHDAIAGPLEKQIDRAMRLNPTVILILSENSLKSDWVEHEVRAARELGKKMGRDVLCPVALDDSWKSSPWPKRLMEQVMEYNILPFSSWKDDTTFKQTFVKLIDGLQLFYNR